MLDTKLGNFRRKFLFNEILENLIGEFVVDISTDKVITFLSHDFDVTSDVFSQIIEVCAKKYVFDDDQVEFKGFFNREKMLKQGKLSGRKKSIQTIDFRFSKYGEIRWCRGSVHCFYKDNNVFAYIAFMDITETKTAALELIFKAEHDSLTEMHNAAATRNEINKYLSTNGMEGLHAFFIFDLDNFKNVNNAFGHLFGDMFLMHTAKSVRRLFRSDDILGRVGGDEFVVFMKNLSSKRAALKKADELLRAVKNIPNLQGTSFDATVSIGISFYESDNKSYQELFREADRAMYDCKNTGKNNYAIYNDNMDQTTLSYNSEDSKTCVIMDHNASEYVFRLLRDNGENPQAYETVLELIAQHFDIDFAAIYEQTRKSFSFTYQREGFKCASIDTMYEVCNGKVYEDYFTDDMFYFSKNDKELKPEIENLFVQTNCSSAIYYKLTNRGELLGYLCLSRCDKKYSFTRKDALLLRDIANLISIFLFMYRKDS